MSLDTERHLARPLQRLKQTTAGINDMSFFCFYFKTGKKEIENRKTDIFLKGFDGNPRHNALISSAEGITHLRVRNVKRRQGVLADITSCCWKRTDWGAIRT
ncbi:hypothetical protein PoB_000130700 [Plakobranchus ocellatus]|uniref:Uncharacterized protein n=1 Tax=Plakobranchus ocellatus TaxID=259542 RepID=A0AAV3XXC8_9GAST|nr:hypothetical protein PoB_000130700 [Plakobranchus ocellatus]